MPKYRFVNFDEFTPDDPGWSALGTVMSWQLRGATLLLGVQSMPPNAGQTLTLKVEFLSPTMFRVRFNAAGDYSSDVSYAVINRNFGPLAVRLDTADPNALWVDTGQIRVKIDKNPYSLSVYAQDQLISADPPGRGIVYLGEHVANVKLIPAGAGYYGFGEKAGRCLNKLGTTMTFFNLDNFEDIFEFNVPALRFRSDGSPIFDCIALYFSVPFLIEWNPLAATPYSYGLLLDNPSQSYFDIGFKLAGRYYFGSLFGDLDYYFFYGADVRAVLAQFIHLTGRAPMPPKHVFGYQQGAYGYNTRAKLEAAAAAYRANDFPIDGLHIDIDFQDNYRIFTSSQRKFPDAKGMLERLHAAGFKCSTNITALVCNDPLNENGSATPPYQTLESGKANHVFLCDSRDEDPVVNASGAPFFVGAADNGTTPDGRPLGARGYYPDFSRPDVRHWWGDQFDYLVNTLGMDMIWQDMTCPGLAQTPDTPDKTLPLSLYQYDFGRYRPHAKLHNAYGSTLVQATYEGLARLRPNTRNFILARGGYTGLHRYAAVWTGDSASSWEFYQINIPQVLNMGLSGMAIAGSDIGGFANGTASSPLSHEGDRATGGIASPTLLVRWTAMGAFLPWYRNHYDGYVVAYQEPYAYGEPVLSLCRRWVELRYRMLQIFYDAMRQAHLTGLPIVRPLFLNDPADPNVCAHLDHAFFLGDDLLVAPIVEPPPGFGQPGYDAMVYDPVVQTRSVYLPAGSDWYAFTDPEQAPLGAPIQGGAAIEARAAAHEVPVYIRAGAILPLREVEQYVGQKPVNPLTIDVYPGPDRTYRLYQDDGLTMEYVTQGAYRETAISTATAGGRQAVRFVRTVDGYAPPEPFFYVRLLGRPQPPRQVTVGPAMPAAVASRQALAESGQDAWYHDPALDWLLIKVFDVAGDRTVQATF